MKKFAFALTLFVLVFLSSCTDKGNDLETVLDSNLIGTWKITSIYSEDAKASGTIKGIPVSADYSLKGKDYNSSITFSDNPKTVTAEGNVTFVASYTFNDETVTEETLGEAVLNTGTWSLEKNILTVTDDNQDSTNSNIVAYDGTSITLRQSLNEKLNIGEEHLTTSGYVFFVLSK